MTGLPLPAGFRQMAGNVPFLMKDVVLFAASVYLLKQDVMRVALSVGQSAKPQHGYRPVIRTTD
jgi:hypothetical protein